MDVKEKMVELLDNAIIDSDDNYGFPNTNQVADHLIANGVTVQEWISVKDRLPGENVNCIVHYKHAYCNNDGYWAIGCCFYDGEKFQIGLAYKVTHWMPLPEPPKGE